MLKKMGAIYAVLGVLFLGIGIWSQNFSNPFSYEDQISIESMLIELEPWFLIVSGIAVGCWAIIFLLNDSKPMEKRKAKVIEKNAKRVMFEFEDGSRKTLIILGKITFVTGDVGLVGYKGAFLIEFQK